MILAFTALLVCTDPTALAPPTAGDTTHAAALFGASLVYGSDDNTGGAVVWTNGVAADLGHATGTSASFAGAAGTRAVGTLVTAAGSSAFVVQNGIAPLTALASLGASTVDIARAINTAGDVVGTSGGQAVVWPGAVTPPVALQVNAADAFGIDDAGIACGQDAVTGAVAWLDATGAATPIALPSTAPSAGLAVNDAAVPRIAGFQGATPVPVVWDAVFDPVIVTQINGFAIRALPLPNGFGGGKALALDDDGDVVGFATSSANPSNEVAMWWREVNGAFVATALPPVATGSRATGVFFAAGVLTIVGDLAGSATVWLEHAPDAPTANLDLHFGTGTTATIGGGAPGVIAVLTDVDGDAVTAVAHTYTSDAAQTFTVAADGSFTYTRGAALEFNDVVHDVAVTDGFFTTVGDVNINGVDHAPALKDGALITATYHPTAVTPAFDSSASPDDVNLLDQIDDADNNDIAALDTLTVSDAGTIATDHGSVVVTATGGFVYTPTTGYVGDDSFTVHVSDGIAAPLPVTFTLTLVDDAPVAADDEATATFLALGSASVQVLVNDSDPDGDPLGTVAAEITTDHGAVTVDALGNVTWSGNRFTGDDTFQVEVTDGWVTSQSNVTVHGLTGGTHKPGGNTPEPATGCGCTSGAPVDAAPALCGLAVACLVRRRRRAR